MSSLSIVKLLLTWMQSKLKGVLVCSNTWSRPALCKVCDSKGRVIIVDDHDANYYSTLST